MSAKRFMETLNLLTEALKVMKDGQAKDLVTRARREIACLGPKYEPDLETYDDWGCKGPPPFGITRT